MKPLNLGWLSRRRDTVLPILLASVALLLSCDRRTSELLAPEPEQVSVLPRFAAGTTVPEVGWVKASLTVNGETSDTTIKYQKNAVISLGKVPVNSSFTISLAGYDSLDGKTVLRWWGSVAGSAGIEATKSVTITPETVKTSSALADVLKRLDTPNVGDTLKLGGDTLFYAPSSSDPRTMISPSFAIENFVFKDMGDAKFAYRSVVGEHILWSELITVTVRAKDDTTPKSDTSKPDTSTSIRALTAAPGNWTSAFDSSKSNWSLSVSHNTTSIQFKADLASSTVKLTINDKAATAGQDTALAISKDTNTFALAVTNGAAPRLCTLIVVRRDSVTAPAFDSAGGWYLQGFQAKLLAKGKSDTIRYTVDGKEPTSTSDVYTGPISAVSDSFVIQAISFRGDDSSRVVSATFRIAREDTNTYGIPWNEALTTGRLVDTRDGNVYRTVEINGKTWMAQNLNYRGTTGSKDSVGMCYNGNSDSCKKYGRIYQFASVSNVCPADWRLPDTTDWLSLRNGMDSAVAGRSLKSRVGWDSVSITGINRYFGADGIDEFGFRGIPSSFIGDQTTTAGGGSFTAKGGITAQWWSSVGNAENAIASELKAGKSYINIGENDGDEVFISQSIFTISKRLTSTFVSVRCVKKTTP